MFNEGMVVKGPFWAEPIELKKVENLGTNTHIIGSTIYSNDLVESLLDETDLSLVSLEEMSLDFSAPPIEVFLALEAQRYKYASIFDPFLAMTTSSIDPLPFQLDAVYLHALKQPTMRFMIADDPGAGKTIMAGLIIKELKLRGLAKRILVVSPGHLKSQWERELREKFQESFQIVDRSFINIHESENPWEVKNQYITSIDFAKQKDIKNMLNGTDWDLVIVDEAHKMAAYSWGKNTHKTQAYKLGEVLSRTSEHLLFLTATPHKGDSENYRLLLDLLWPGFFVDPSMLIEAKRQGDNPLFIRRVKEDLRDFDGKPIFTKRFTNTVKFTLSEEEMELYQELSKYVQKQYNKAISNGKKRHFVFALLLLQRRLASSIYALYCSLKRKKEKFEEYSDNPELLIELKNMQIKDREDSAESERWEEEERLEEVTLAESFSELEKEIETINWLLGKAESILEFGDETKLSKLREILGTLGDEKVLIFSEAKDTVDYLIDKVRSWGYSVNTIHGGMNMSERVNAEQVFKDETQIMIATEAAGEGINLQFCHLMINYDIPWNPNRLEQRMGRIHRYKQNKDVHIFNFVAGNTREGQVLETILNKLDEIKNSMGSDKVFDVVGEVFQGRDLYNLISEAVSGERDVHEIQRELDIEVDEEYKARLQKEVLEQGLNDKINYEKIFDMSKKTSEIRLMPDYLYEFFKKTYDLLGGRYNVRKDGYISIQSIPQDLKKIAREESFKRLYGTLKEPTFLITFDKNDLSENEKLEYITFGHPFLESLILWVENELSPKMRRGCCFLDPQGVYSGVLWFFEVSVKDGSNEDVGKKIIAIHDDGKSLKNVNPAVLWDLKPNNLNYHMGKFDYKPAQIHAINSVKEYMLDIKEERDRQAKVKQKYGVKSLQQKIDELDADIVDLELRLVVGEKVDLALNNKKIKQRDYRLALEELEKEIIKEKSLSLTMPKLLGAINVASDNKSMNPEEKLELMKAFSKYENKFGRDTEFLDEDYIGFDFKSFSDDEKRYICLKNILDNRDITFTFNEVVKASKFGDEYWLYVLDKQKNKVYAIQNPLKELNIEEYHDVTIPAQIWENTKYFYDNYLL